MRKNTYIYAPEAGTREMTLYVYTVKVHNGGSRQHEAALVINRFSRKRNVTGNLVQTGHRVMNRTESAMQHCCFYNVFNLLLPICDVMVGFSEMLFKLSKENFS